MLLFCHQEAEQNHDIKIANRYFENVAQFRYEVLLKSSWTVIVVTALVKDERGGQGHTSASLLHQSAT
jgi:hypothetical protein